MPQEPDAAIAALARKQQRNITRAQMRALGVSSDAIDHRVRRGWLHREHNGVYYVGTPATTPLEHAAAAVLACGRGAAVSHGSALALWSLAKRWPSPVHVMTQTDRRPSGLIVHRTTKLARADIRTHLGIRTTSPARALLDCAPTMPITRAVNDALRSPFLTQAQLADVCARNPKHPGTKLLAEFLDDLTSGPTRSEFEDAFPGFCVTFGLPVPLLNVIVCGYEVDAYFPDHGVIVELDGWAFHRDRVTFESDRNRDAYTLAAGLVTVRITWARMTTDPEHEADRLYGILEQQRARRSSGAWPPSGG